MKGMRSIAVACVACLLGAGCGQQTGLESGPVERSGIQGSYQADTLTASGNGGSIDLLARGSSLDLTLEEDGSMSGRLFLPGGLDGQGSGEDVQLVGSWTFDRATQTVTLMFEREFFPEPITLEPSRIFRDVAQELAGETVLNGSDVRIVLANQIGFSL